MLLLDFEKAIETVELSFLLKN